MLLLKVLLLRSLSFNKTCSTCFIEKPQWNRPLIYQSCLGLEPKTTALQPLTDNNHQIPSLLYLCSLSPTLLCLWLTQVQAPTRHPTLAGPGRPPQYGLRLFWSPENLGMTLNLVDQRRSSLKPQAWCASKTRLMS